MLNKADILGPLRESGVVAVIRTETPKDLTAVARALRQGGVKYVEITLTVPGALRIIADAAAELAGEDVFIGAGTVLDADTARAAIGAGASYVVSPIFDAATVKLCNDAGVPVMAAGMTPT
jgi:2-dehydro-3-deoxyphosphogluconate aldolase/(4S)-4-hydroxy-2-oxoglutarate aldolase